MDQGHCKSRRALEARPTKESKDKRTQIGSLKVWGQWIAAPGPLSTLKVTESTRKATNQPRPVC